MADGSWEELDKEIAVVSDVVKCHLDTVDIFKLSRPTRACANGLILLIIEPILNILSLST